MPETLGYIGAGILGFALGVLLLVTAAANVSQATKDQIANGGVVEAHGKVYRCTQVQ